MKKMVWIFLMLFLMISGESLIADAVIPGVVNLEIKDEDGDAILLQTDLSCEVWLNDGYADKVTFTSQYVDFTEIGGVVGIMVIDAKALYLSGPGDFLYVWVQYTGSGNQQGTMKIPLTDANTQAYVGPEALILTSKIDTKSFASGSLNQTFLFNNSRSSGTVCNVQIILPADSEGSLTTGLLSQKPGTLPGSVSSGDQALDFGFYFDKKALTTLSSGNISITITWSSAVSTAGFSGTTEADQGLFLSEDGLYWVNTKNVSYTRDLSKYGTTLPDFSVSFSSLSGSVSFDIDHIPHSIVFGNGAGTYTESTPPQSAGLTAAIVNTSDLQMTWSESPQPGVSYDMQEFSESWSDMSISGSITGTTTRSYTVTSATGSDYKLYRTKVTNNSGQSSYSQIIGYVKNTLAPGDNMVGYSMGSESQKISSLETEIGSSAGIKIWNHANQSWQTPASGNVTLGKGDVFLVNVESETTWYSVGPAYPADGPQAYTLSYSSTSGSGYNPVIIRANKIVDGIDTVEELYNDIFGSRGTDSYPRTISWYDQSSGFYTTYDSGPLSSYLGSTSISIGDTFLIHIGLSDNNTAWSQE